MIKHLCLRYDSRTQLFSLRSSCHFSNSETGTRKPPEDPFSELKSLNPCVLDSSTAPQEQFCFKWPCKDGDKQIQWRHTRTRVSIKHWDEDYPTTLHVKRKEEIKQTVLYWHLNFTSHISSIRKWPGEKGRKSQSCINSCLKAAALSKVIQIDTLSTKELLKQFTITVIYRCNIIENTQFVSGP